MKMENSVNSLSFTSIDIEFTIMASSAMKSFPLPFVVALFVSSVMFEFVSKILNVDTLSDASWSSVEFIVTDDVVFGIVVCCPFSSDPGVRVCKLISGGMGAAFETALVELAAAA